MVRLSAALGAVSLALAFTEVNAQSPTPRADPLDPQASVPAARPPEALRRYRPASTPDAGGWREANEQVARIGGWKTYLREAQAPEAPAASPAAPPARPASAPAAGPRQPGGHQHGLR